jgi:geranylgeranyl pyrophosphate synthase
LELNAIYGPVNADLQKIEDALQEVGNIEFDWLSQLLNHSLCGGGKRIRPALTLMSGLFYNYRFEFLQHMAVSIELMHTATLVHDDAIDKSDFRRGKVTVYKLCGIEPAVLLGDYLFAKAGVEVADTQNLRAVHLFSQTLMTISSGELNQAKNAFNLNQTIEDYIQRIFGKTASLFCLATESGGVLSQAPEGSIKILREYGHNLGLAFQIVDDILDYTGTESELGKPAGSDLKQGTYTMPAMLMVERYPEDNPVKRFFEDRSKLENIPKAIEQIRNSDIVDECYKAASTYRDKACRAIQPLPDNPVKESFINLAEFVVKRRV